MQVKVLFFATIRERTGVRETNLELPAGLTVRDFKWLIVKQFPALDRHLSSALIAINREFAFDEQIIPDSAEIALFPPVSGG